MINLKLLICLFCACFCFQVYADTDFSSDDEVLAASKDKYALTSECRFFPPKG